MIEYPDITQGTQEWINVRLGIPTASRFCDIITPKTMKPSASAQRYLEECAAEWMLGEALDGGSSQFMQRGTKLEDEARKWYEMEYDADVRTVGFVTTDDGRVGCSPDGLIDPDGGLEIKSPGAKKHVQYMRNPDSLEEDYRAQVQGALYVTERKWWDIVSYNPAMRSVVVRCEPNEAFQAALSEALADFVSSLDNFLVREGYKKEAVPA